MTSHLADTDWFIDYLKGRPEARQAIGDLMSRAVLATSVVTVGEMLEGALGSRDQVGHTGDIGAMLSAITVLSPDVETARIYAEVRSSLRAAGLLIGDNDLWIAATALQHDLILLSRDKHFERVSGLKLFQAP